MLGHAAYRGDRSFPVPSVMHGDWPPVKLGRETIARAGPPASRGNQATEKLSPQPQRAVSFGFEKVKPDCSFDSS
jgi:hypothetical protein